MGRSVPLHRRRNGAFRNYRQDNQRYRGRVFSWRYLLTQYINMSGQNVIGAYANVAGSYAEELRSSALKGRYIPFKMLPAANTT